MKKQYIFLITVLFLSSVFSFVLVKTSITEKDLEPNSNYKPGKSLLYNETNKPDEWMEYERSMTMGSNTVEDSYLLMRQAYEQTLNMERVDPAQIYWEERGPTNVGGRTRAIMWDPNDPSNLKCWAGGVSGGLWYTNNMMANNVSWQKVDDFWDNLAITCIAYDRTNKQEFYVGTGEGWFDDSGIPGGGIWKSADGGANWYHLASTSGNDFRYVHKIIVHYPTGYVYAATKNSGVQRSTNGGVTWDTVLSASDLSLSNIATDLEMTQGHDILAAMGLHGESDGIYISSTGDLGDWTRINDGSNDLPTAEEGIRRIELAVAFSNPDIIYALIEDSTKFLKGIYKSTDKGINWEQITTPMLNDTTAFPGNQTWYDLIAGDYPLDANVVFVGGVSLHRSTDAGDTWEKIEGIHDDHHAFAFRPGNPETLVFGNDGGVYLTEDCTESPLLYIDRNHGYRVTQFHAVALHPGWGEDYFLGGTQDNGTQQLTGYGMNMANHVLNADGGFCYILKSNPMYQIASKQHNRFYLSTDGGNSFNDPIYVVDTTGKFISQWDYDENNHVMYATYSKNSILRIKNVINPVQRSWDTTSYNNLFSNWATAFKVSPFSDGTLFVGTEDGRLFKITNAHSISNYYVTEITGPAFNPSWINCIELGPNEDQILVVFSWYGVISVWETLDGGVTWESKEGNLPNMPIRWAIYNPLDYRQVMLATETGIFTTEDITMNPVQWLFAGNGMGNVRTTMLRIRESDNLVIAGTYGRGIFSTNAFSVSPSTKILASDGQAEDHFGDAVATNGDFAIVGTPNEDERGNNAGAVYFYEQLNNQWNESAKVLASDGSAEDNFGNSVDIHGDLAIVGARGDDQIGSAYIYRLLGNSWNLDSKIAPNDGNIGDGFGQSVAIYDNVAAVGAYGSGDYGAVYIFTYQAGNWTQTLKIIPEDGENADWFGHSVDLDWNYLVVGNPYDDDDGINSGSAYVYHYDNDWTLDKKVTAADGDDNDHFGYSVAIDGQNIVIGAFDDEGINGQPEAGSAYVYFNSITSNWEQTAKLWAHDAVNYQNFGNSVSIFGNNIIVGASRDEELAYWSGAAYVFRYDTATNHWVQQNKIFADDGGLEDYFGHSVHLFGSSAIVSSIFDDDNGDNSGSAYIFKSIINENNLPILSLTPSFFELSSSQTTVDIHIHNNAPANNMNWIAYSVDPWMQIISDSTGTNSGTVTINVDENLYCPRTGRIIVRAPGALHSPREVSIYQKAGPNTNEVDITPPNLNEDDFFGDWVDVDGEYAIVGAQGDDQYGAEAGVAYIFKRDGCCSWIQKAKLHASDAVDFDNFGRSVSISGDVAIVSNVNFDHPTIYLFQKPTGGWQDMTESAKLSPPGGQANYTFGKVADISGEYVIASVPGTYPPYIMFYERPTGGWLDMTPTVVIEKDIFGGFGESLVLDGVYAVIGSPMENGNTGCVYVYKRDWNWGEQVRLAPSDGTANDNFGKSVDLSDDLIIVGAHIERAAYIYRNNGSQWIEEQKIPSPTGTLGFAIGTKSVAIEKNIALVGDHYGGDGGCVFSFTFGTTGWSFSKQTSPSDVQADDGFGTSLDISGPYTIINSTGKDNSGLDAGGAYIFCTESDIVTSVSTSQEEFSLPISYDLKQNYPNPFNPTTTIVFDLPKPTNVTLKIYTILGEEVTTLVSEELKAGTHKYMWDPVSLASGVYLYRIESKEFTITKKMVFLK